MAEKIILIGCYEKERVLSNSIFSSLKKFENTNYQDILSKKQKKLMQ